LAAQGEEDGREVEEEEDGREAAACFLAAARPTGGEGGAREDGRGSWGKNEREKDVGLRVWGAGQRYSVLRDVLSLGEL
jgi:hypothetical protein